jgi:hypothetical protein
MVIKNQFMKRVHFYFSPVIFLVTFNCFAQTNADLQKKYTVVNREISTRTDGSIHLNEKDGVGIAWINKQKFATGTIECDIKGKDVLQASFVGIVFHGVNDSTYETVYFRPFNFRAADTVRRSHAVQYIAPPAFDWPKLRSESPNKYEQSISPAPDPNNWFHVRIEVGDKLIRVFVNSNTKPSLVVEPLVHSGSTMMGYWVGGGTDGDWKNLRITPAKQ